MTANTGKKATPAMVAVGLLALLALLASFGVRLWWFLGAAPLPALLQNLDDSADAGAQQAFAARLAQKFPPGSKEAALIEELRGEGFRIRADVRPPQGEAAYDRAAGLNDLCRRGGSVRWEAENGALRTITGGFYTHCPAKN
jgi:hypothetical protein